MTDQDARERLGTTLGGRWTLDELLGTGGSSAVYAAHHRNGRRAAVKVLHRTHAARNRFRRRFLAEGYAANRVGHPGAVAVLDDGEAPDGTVFLVMEHLSGASLATRLEEGTFSEHDVIVAALGVLDVLAAAHDRGIVHRDVKPSNVFLTDDGAIKLLDFGSARVAEEDALLTPCDTVLGTPAFMAPELAGARTDEVDARTDIWAVGATMFQLLTGETVHAARTKNESLIAAATRCARGLMTARARTTPELAAIVDRALSFQQSERWPNARAMRAALSTLVQGTADVFDGSLVTLPAQSPPVLVTRRHGAMAKAAVVACCMGVLSLFLAANAPKKGTTPAARRPPLIATPTLPVSVSSSRPQLVPHPVAADTPAPAPNAPRKHAAPMEHDRSRSRPSSHPDVGWHVDDVLDRRK